MTQDLRSCFSLNPDITFLNHGSYGAVPNVVVDEISVLYRKISANPVSFFDPGRRGEGVFNQNTELAAARKLLGEMMDAEAADIVGVTNASYALTAAVRSLTFCAGDEIVVTNHEYGAVMKLLELMRREHGIVVKVDDIPADLADEQTFVDRIIGALFHRRCGSGYFCGQLS